MPLRSSPGTRLKQRLRTPTDTIADELISEAMSLRAFLEGRTDLPWTPQLNDPDESRRVIGQDVPSAVDIKDALSTAEMALRRILL